MPRSESPARRRDRRSSRDRGSKAKRSRSGDRRIAKKRAEASRSKEREADRRAARSASPARRHRSRSRSRGKKVRSPTKSPSPKRPRRRSRTPERVPPTDFADYEPAADGGGWYVYKKTGKWRYHPETGLYMHVKSRVYYVQKENDAKAFRKIEDEEDPVVKKMKQSEEMRKAIQSTEFVRFDEGGGGAAATEEGSAVVDEQAASKEAKPAESEPVAKEEAAPEPEVKVEGRVQNWNSDKGFGFIMPVGKDSDDARGLFVHRKNIVGSTANNPINLKEGGKVLFLEGLQDNRKCALEVLMIGADGRPLPVHAGAQSLEEKKRSYFVSAEALGVRVHAESWPGLKKTLQDRYVVDEAMEELGVFFGVFDGHGGTQVADIAAKTLCKSILQHFRQKQVQPASRDEKIRAAVKEAFLQTDKEILAAAERKKFEQVGSTAVCALLHGNPKLGGGLRLVVPNIGDSRAVLCRGGVAVAATEDHKPTRHDEKKRIERAGGLVLQIRGCARIAAPMNPNSTSKAQRREYQGLAMTRSFGDLHFKTPTPLASAEPETQIVPLTDKDLFCVLATDGIFDVLSNQEVVDLALKYWEDPEEAAKSVIRAAYKKGSEDNLTALVMQFGWSDKNALKYVEKRKQAAALAAAHEDGASTKAVLSLAKAGGALKPVDDGVDMFG